MQGHTFFALFCAISVGMNAFIAGVPVRPRPRLSLDGNASISHKNVVPQIPSEFGTMSKAKDAGERDAISDLILYLLKLTVGAFLGNINNNLQQITTWTNNGKTRLETAIVGLDAATIQQIRQISERLTTGAINIITPLLGKLNRVLPSLTSTSVESRGVNMDPNDIIYIILGMSLEDFLREIAAILQASDSLFTSTMSSLTSIAQRVNPTSAGLLMATSAEMGNAKAAIRPILSNLREVLPDIIYTMN